MAVADYLDWFGFSDLPFRLSPDLDFFYPAKPHRQVVQVLKYAISRGEGFMVLSGYAGTGKTLLLRYLIKDLPDDKKIAFIVTPSVSPKGLMLLLLQELGDDLLDHDTELALLLKKFQEKIIELANEQKRLLIIIDEAQDLPVETIEQLRLLSNIETGKEKLLQILLVGQPELQNLLADTRLCQLTQRIAVNEILHPLTRKETEDYVKFRLSRAGRGDLSMSPRFIKKLHESSKGIPRLINRLMDRSLLMAASSSDQHLKTHHLDLALDTLPQPQIPFKGEVDKAINWSLRKLILIFFLVLMVLGLVIFLVSERGIVKKLFFKNGSMWTNATQNLKEEDNCSLLKIIRITSDKTYIRANPLKNSSILSIAKKGERYKVLSTSDNWVLVEFARKGTAPKTGWITKDAIKELKVEGFSSREKIQGSKKK